MQGSGYRVQNEGYGLRGSLEVPGTLPGLRVEGFVVMSRLQGSECMLSVLGLRALVADFRVHFWGFGVWFWGFGGWVWVWVWVWGLRVCLSRSGPLSSCRQPICWPPLCVRVGGVSFGV